MGFHGARSSPIAMAPVRNGGDGGGVGWPTEMRKMRKLTGSMCACDRSGRACDRSGRAAEEGVDVSGVDECRRRTSCAVAWWQDEQTRVPGAGVALMASEKKEETQI